MLGIIIAAIALVSLAINVRTVVLSRRDMRRARAQFVAAFGREARWTRTD